MKHSRTYLLTYLLTYARAILTVLVIVCCLKSTSTAQYCWTFGISPTIVFDEPGGGSVNVDADLNFSPCTATSAGFKAYLFGNLPSSNIQVLYNGLTYNFTNGVSAVFIVYDTVTDLDFIVNLPSGATCGSVYNVQIRITPTIGETLDSDPTDSFTLRRTQANITGANALCNNITSTYTIAPDIAVTGAFSISITGGTGWKINGVTTSNATTTALTFTITTPATYNNSATITVTHPDLACSGTVTLWVGKPAAPGSIAYGQWIGHNCYSWGEWQPVPGALSYTSQFGLGTGTTYGPADTGTNTHTTIGWAPGTTLHIRVNATNSCGTSAWQVKQDTTPLTPIYPNCNGN